jgi:hypothetical protein
LFRRTLAPGGSLSSTTSTGCPTGFIESSSAALAPETNPFKSKIVAVTYIDGHNAIKVPLEQAKVQKLGERYFIVGKVVYSSISRFMVGTTLWIPENTVTSIAEFESVEKMTDAFLQSSQERLSSARPQSLPRPTPTIIK